jgi:hypothetical protein
MKPRNRGQILVLFTISLVVLIGMAALGVDVGYMYSVRHDLQRCADAGALAGASYFKETGYWSSVAGDPQMAIAEARARAFATSDNVITSPLNDNEVIVSFPENFRIRVDTQRTVDLFFSRIFLGPTKLINAYAVAEAFPVTANVECIVPWGIPLPWEDDNENGAWDPGEGVNWPPPDDDCGTLASTMWSYTTHDNVGTQSDRDQQLCQGSLQKLKIGEPSEQLVPGNFFGLNLAPLVESCPGYGGDIDNGAAFYSYMIKHSCDCNMKVSLEDDFPVETKPGNMVNKTLNPVAPTPYWHPDNYIPHKPDADSLMNLDPTARWDPFTNKPVSDDPDYADIWNSPRVIRLPVYYPDPTYKNGEYTPTQGRSTFKPVRFVGFFVEDIQRRVSGPSETNSIVGRFMTVGGPGMSGGPDPGDTGPHDLNIRLVE